jgi:phi LC3 family holin
MQINWKVRFKNPVFIAQLLLSVLAPILAYTGLSYADLTTWGALFDVLKQAVSNPYVLAMVAVSLYNAVTDPTTKGHKDSKQALNYQKPRKDKQR